MKLQDLAQHEAALEADTNPFAKIVLAHLKTQQTQGDSADRKAWKLRLVRGLYDQGFSSNDVRELFRLIDWLMELPTALKQSFWEDVAKIEEEKHMPFITTPERLALCRGMRVSIQIVLRTRFGADGLELMPKIEMIYDEDQLQTILMALVTAVDLAEVSRLVSSIEP